MNQIDAHDRRRHPRTMFVRPCKVRSAGRTRYTPAATSDLSSGGTLLRVPSSHLYAVDDLIEVAVAWNNQPLLESDQALRGRVRRVVPIDHHHNAIGVEFHAALPSALSAAA